MLRIGRVAGRNRITQLKIRFIVDATLFEHLPSNNIKEFVFQTPPSKKMLTSKSKLTIEPNFVTKP